MKQHFLNIVVSCTISTAHNVVDFLKDEGLKVTINPSTKHIDNYLNAVKKAKDLITNSSTQKIFYLDFDRLIHWSWKYPKELLEVLNIAKNVEYLHLERSPRAFETHPSTQRYTENIVNYIGSKVLRFSDTHDLISVCYIFTENLAEKLIDTQYYTNMGFYSTWPIILSKFTESKQYFKVEGQEWETPDRFEPEIKKFGYQNWLEQYQTAQEWKRRVELLNDCIIEISHLIDFQLKI